MRHDFEYRLAYSSGAKPILEGRHLHIELDSTGVPPGGVHWQFSTRFRPSRSSYSDVLIETIIKMCKKHNLTPLDVRLSLQSGCGGRFVDVIFAKGADVLKVYENEISFDFYGTQPKVVDRGTPNPKHMALCIQLLPRKVNFNAVVDALRTDPRMLEAGRISDVWSLHRPESGVFTGKILALLELRTLNAAVAYEARAAVPGWFVFRGTAYLVRFCDRPMWCFDCRYNDKIAFHSLHTCPFIRCQTCRARDHASVNCPTRQAQVACKKRVPRELSDDVEDQEEDPSLTEVERKLAKLGVRNRFTGAVQLARDFGVLALSEDDLGN
ncbi:uncharacterized protein MEPE_00528 [Melanopsichium pennsylvanicum]|uniref:CCHC-type domain-containing protein n=2 Tax=Melanopsichium pennsylvanicum TaxID=63383 RepID=A0AAJ5C2R8_9BASI|nr:uncharacterized protein MEPE_00528 [Melanopsichium pennsylvanicum]